MNIGRSPATINRNFSIVHRYRFVLCTVISHLLPISIHPQSAGLWPPTACPPRVWCSTVMSSMYAMWMDFFIRMHGIDSAWDYYLPIGLSLRLALCFLWGMKSRKEGRTDTFFVQQDIYTVSQNKVVHHTHGDNFVNS